MGPRGILIVAIMSAVGGASVTRAYFAREVVRTVEKEVVKDHIVTVTKESKAKDGTESIITTTTDDRAATDNKNTVDTKPAQAPQWLISGGAGLTVNGLPVYAGSVQRRIIGPVFLGLQVTTQKEGFVTLGIEF